MFICQPRNAICKLFKIANSSLLVALFACFVSVIAPSAIAAKELSTSEVKVSVNINKAGIEELAQSLHGVGMKKAEAIVTYRTEFGSFESVEDLVKVKGIGQETFNKNRERISI